MRIKSLLALSQKKLIDSLTSTLDAEVLLGEVLHCDRAFLYTHPEYELVDNQLNCYLSFIERRQKGEPIAYITGHQEFWSMDLQVTPDVLIPRPETELLVELILNRFSKNQKIRLADLGTGSGAIAIAIASERPDWEIFATDMSKKALAIAKKNAKRCLLMPKTAKTQQNIPKNEPKFCHIQFSQGDWCHALPKRQFDVIVSNPPYIRKDDAHLTQGDIAFEPKSALIAGEEGLDAYKTIIKDSRTFLNKGGLLAFEIGYDQASVLEKMMQTSGFEDIQILQDLSKNDRIILGRI